jgi:hypothetical protein
MYQIRTSEAGSYGPLFRGHRKSFRHSLDQRSTGKELERPTPDLGRRSGGSSSACRQTTAAAAATPTLHLNYDGQTSPPPFLTGSADERAIVRRAPAGSSVFLVAKREKVGGEMRACMSFWVPGTSAHVFWTNEITRGSVPAMNILTDTVCQ